MLKRFPSAFALGFIAGVGLLLPSLLGLGILADAAGWSDVELAIGSMPIWDYERSGDSSSTSIGAGVLVIGGILGVLNMIGSALILARTPEVR